MSGYNARRAPNVSQYIANLNTIPSAADMAAQQDFSNFVNDDLAWADTQFVDFDVNEPFPELPSDIAFPADQQRQSRNMGQEKSMSFVNQPNYQFNSFPAFPQSGVSNHASPHVLPPSPPNGIQGGFPGQLSRPTVPSASVFSAIPQTGDKRNSSDASLDSPDNDLEEGSRYAAEEDKRRRNTAASARFRVKKKQREQALEKSAREMSDKVAVLEARVGQLEMENKWLKGLITEKNLKIDGGAVAAGPADAAAAGVEAQVEVGGKEIAGGDAAAADVKAIEQKIEEGERSTEERKDGVGTAGNAVMV